MLLKNGLLPIGESDSPLGPCPARRLAIVEALADEYQGSRNLGRIVHKRMGHERMFW